MKEEFVHNPSSVITRVDSPLEMKEEFACNISSVDKRIYSESSAGSPESNPSQIDEAINPQYLHSLAQFHTPHQTLSHQVDSSTTDIPSPFQQEIPSNRSPLMRTSDVLKSAPLSVGVSAAKEIVDSQIAAVGGTENLSSENSSSDVEVTEL